MKRKHLHAVILVTSFLLAGIQPAIAIDIPTNTSVGTWDETNRIYTLTTDVSEGLVITEDNLTLDGAGYSVTGAGAGYGVHLPLRTGVTIKNLTVQNFNWGIYLDCSSVNTLTGNTASNNDNHGICLISANYNTVTDNTASNNNRYGIYLNGSSGNVLSRNTVEYNNSRGIYLKNSSNNNTIYNNNFIDNKTQAYVDGGTGNVFSLDNPAGGNYWSNWNTPDDNGDGFVDNPYAFTDGQDNLPWTVQDGWLDPVNQAPVADAGPDQTVECKCQTPEGTQVILDGTGSYDPDGDPLTYTWTGDFAETPTNGATPTVTLDGCQPSYVITLVVNDGELDSEDTVTITVEDTTPPDMTPPGDTTVEAMGPDGVPVDDDEIQTFLDGVDADDDCTPKEQITITNDAPDVFLPGDTLVTFTAADESGNNATCESTVTVVEAAESHLRIVPPIINREGILRRILAVIRFPEGYTEDDIDMDVPLVLFPGDSPYGIQATSQRIVTWYTWGTLHVSIFGFFPKDEVTAAVPDGLVEFMVVGRFVDGQYFYGIRTGRIVSWDWKRW